MSSILIIGGGVIGLSLAREFHKNVKFDGSILTKSDADARGGAALSIVKVTNTPILYLGIGQEYPDLKPFSKETFLKTVFETETVEPIISKPEPTVEESEQAVEKIEPVVEEPEPVVEEPEPVVEETETVSSSDDPFKGIKTEDIDEYVEMFEEHPPENDKQAQELSLKIKKWISDGKPKS